MSYVIIVNKDYGEIQLESVMGKAILLLKLPISHKVIGGSKYHSLLY